MKIIKNGNNLKTYKGKCPFCDCEYEYEASDVQTEHNLTNNAFVITCPWCGCRNDAYDYTQQVIPQTYTIGDFFPKYDRRDISYDTYDTLT